MVSDGLLQFCFGSMFGFIIASGLWARQWHESWFEKAKKSKRRELCDAKTAVTTENASLRSEPADEDASLSKETLSARKVEAHGNRKPRQHLPRGQTSSRADAATAFQREVLCEDAVAWLEGLESGLPPGSCVLTGIPDIHEVDAEGKMGLEGYMEWFQKVVKLILKRLPESGRAIFMQTDVKVSQNSSHGRNAGGGSYWQWLDKAHLAMLAADGVPNTRLLWHKIIFSGAITAGGRSGLSATYTHYFCFTRSETPEALDGCALPDVLRKGLSTWKSGAGAEAVELACAYLKKRGCLVVVDPFCGEGAVLAIANHLGMTALGVELNKKRAQFARTLDGRVLIDADRAERGAKLEAARVHTAMSDERKHAKDSRTTEAQRYDGLSPLHLNLDDEGGVLYYLPSLVGVDANSWFNELEEVFCRAQAQLPKPPKDTSDSNGRAQYYGVAPQLRANPRWCNAARPLEGESLSCVFRIKAAVESALSTLPLSLEGDEKASPLNSVLLNRYDDGRSQIAWHADDETCYGPSDSILIASVSLGAARRFELRRKPRKGDVNASAQQRKEIVLQPGSLLVMAGTTQANWQHCVPAEEGCRTPRINLTFRRIVGERRRGETHV